MNSLMVYVPAEVEVTVINTMLDGLDFYISTRGCQAPKDVRKWIEGEVWRTFELSWEEEQEMENLVMRKLEFEVELWYKEDTMKAKTATCQTECPNFVKAWVEQEAMNQFNKEHEGCVKSTI